MVAERSLSRLVVEVIERLDLSKLTRQYADRNSAAHYPAVLLGLPNYGQRRALQQQDRTPELRLGCLSLRVTRHVSQACNDKRKIVALRPASTGHDGKDTQLLTLEPPLASRSLLPANGIASTPLGTTLSIWQPPLRCS